MKIITKIASLTLLTLCLQLDAAQYSPGIQGVKATCAVFMKSGVLKISGAASEQFKTAYGLDAKNVCPFLSDIDAIQAFVNDPAKFDSATQMFVDDAAVQEFVGKFTQYGNLLANPKIFSTNYLDVAEDWLEHHVHASTGQAAALQEIATAIEPLTGKSAPANLDARAIKRIIASAKTIDSEEEAARKFLNELRLTFNKTTNTLESDPMPVLDASMAPIYPKEVYQSALMDYIQTTFARRLQNIMPNFSILPLINDTATPLVTTLLSKSKKSLTDYVATEAQADAVIKAMANQINATDAELKRVAAIAPAYPLAAGTLEERATELLNHLSAGGGSAGITTYLDAGLANSLYTKLSGTVVKNTRNALGLATGKKAKGKNTAINAIVAGLQADAAYVAATTAEEKVKAAITYLTSQLYQSYMWLTKDTDGTAATRLTAIPGVPAYASGSAQDVAAAAQGRITVLIDAIKALKMENDAFRSRPGAAITLAAETDANVVAAETAAASLTTLTPCVNVTGTPAAKLAALPAAVRDMASTLTTLSAGLPVHPNGATLATAIRDHINATNPAVAQLARAQADVAQLRTQLTAATATGADAAQLRIDLAAAQANVTRLEAEVAAKFDQAQVTAITSAAKSAEIATIKTALIDQAGGGMFTAFSGGFNLAGLTVDAPTATSTLSEVGNYFRECAEAANLLQTLAGLTLMPRTMADLMTQSSAAIRAKFVAAAIPAAIIAGHNASVKVLLARFNAGASKVATKALLFDWITSLNAAAATINAITPGAAQVITLTTGANDVTANKNGITDATTATAA